MLCDEIITDYKIVSVNRVKKYLAKGYQLYGPIITFANHKKPLLQAIVKKAFFSKNTREIVRVLGLNTLEMECVNLLAKQKKIREISMILKKPLRTIEYAFKSLRKKLHCENNIGIILTARQLGLITCGKPQL